MTLSRYNSKPHFQNSFSRMKRDTFKQCIKHIFQCTELFLFSSRPRFACRGLVLVICVFFCLLSLTNESEEDKTFKQQLHFRLKGLHGACRLPGGSMGGQSGSSLGGKLVQISSKLSKVVDTLSRFVQNESKLVQIFQNKSCICLQV